MRKYKLGILGGRRGAFILYYIHMFKDELEVAAICESDPKVIEEVKANADMDSENVAFCSTFDELLRYDIDAVFLANSFNEHTEYAIKAMEKGIVVFSETTAAASLGECIDLVEAYERTGTTYMLSAECIYFRAVLAMKERIRRGEIGQVVYADAEYVHPRTPGNVEEVDKTNLHWRNTLPGCYYNMHDLGPLLYMTDSSPKRVVAKAAVVEGVSVKPLVNATRCDALVETESGSVLHYSGCTGVGTLGKWYRIAGTGGTLESVRFDEVEKNIVVGGLHDAPDIVEIDWDDVDILTPEEREKYFPKGRELLSHGGADILIILEFIKVLKGEKEPYFDVYRAVALSATAIMSWYSILSGSRQLDIPDFRVAEDREKHRGDYRQPFAKRYDDLTLPCSVKPSENFKVILEKENKL